MQTGVALAPAHSKSHWRFSKTERIGLLIFLLVVVVYGALLEKRTALRRSPMTDLGVFATASWAVWHQQNPYSTVDWHGWHYQYPPFLAVLLAPLSHPPPEPLPALAPGEKRTQANTPWGYSVDRRSSAYYGLHRTNLRFFWIVAVWYFLSIALFCFSAHALACALEGRRLADPPPERTAKSTATALPFSDVEREDGETGHYVSLKVSARQRWWALRVLPLLACIGSVGTELSRGQMDVVMLAAVAAACYLASRARFFASGVMLSIPAAIKLFPPLIILYPLWRRQWPMAAGVLVGTLLWLVLVPTMAFGPTRTLELYRTWFEVLAKPALGQGMDKSRARELTGMGSTDNQSLLALLHHWQYHNLPKKERPVEASAIARHITYAVGALVVAGTGWMLGLRRNDNSRQLLLIMGVLIGIAFIVSPIVHNFYYLMLLPLIAALLSAHWEGSSPKNLWSLPSVVLVFMVVDILARLPGIGRFLRENGAPLVSIVLLMAAAAVLLTRAKRPNLQ